MVANWKNLELDNLGWKTWNLRKFEKTKTEKPGIMNKNY